MKLLSRVLVGLFVLGVVGAAAGWGVIYFTLLRDLPDIERIEDYRPPLASRVYDVEGRLIGEFADERRMLVTSDEIPRHVVLAFVAGEDASFFEHHGLDYVGILRAAWVNLAAGGEIRQGGSTITQQTVKSLLLTPERKIRRKIKEMILARRLEERFSKDEILFLYLNQIYFGQGAWGIGEAARTYFDKSVSELDVSEAALLAGLPQRPSDYSPVSNPEAAERRRRYVLGRMQAEAFIDEATYEEALARPPELAVDADRDDFRAAAYFVEQIRRVLYDQLGGETVLTGGLEIHTTLDLELQRAAFEAVRQGLRDLDRRQGYRGPVRRVEASAIEATVAELSTSNGFDLAAESPPSSDTTESDPAETPAPITPTLESERVYLGVVTGVDPGRDVAEVAFAPDVRGEARLRDVRWAREPDPSKRPSRVRHIENIFGVGDVVRFRRVEPDEDEEIDDEALPRLTIHQEPTVEASLVSLEVETGAVRALIGGYDYDRSEFDRATQARRQPGSAFKPFVYAAALEQGYTPASIVVDRPVVYEDPESGFVWRPENYSRRFLGSLTMREALSRSVNNATIHLFRELGVGNVIDFVRRLGIEAPLARDLSLALGSSAVTLLELTRAYAVLPAGGMQVIPRFVREVRDRDGERLLEDLILGNPLPPAPASVPEPKIEEDRLAVEPASTAPPRRLASEATGLDPETGETGGRARPGRVMSERLAYLATDMLRAAVFDLRGTGRKARSLGVPVGGKTGTTNDGGDAWFVGFSPDVATGVWVGYDQKKVLGRGETGARAALPIWIDYMEAALARRSRRDFRAPEGIIVARIDPETGLLAPSPKGAYFQPFVAGTEPTETAGGSVTSSERLLRLDSF